MMPFEKNSGEAAESDGSSGSIPPDSSRGAIEAARLEFEALPSEVDSEARQTAFIHLIVSRGFWSRKAAQKNTESKSKPKA